MNFFLLSILAAFTVSLSLGARQTIHSCNFEPSGTCAGYVSSTYTDVNSVTSNDFQSRTGRTPSGGGGTTGPDSAQEGSYYTFFEASFRQTAAKSGTFTSGAIQTGSFSDYKIQFYLYDHGTSLDKFEVNILNAAGAVASTHPVESGGNTLTKAWMLKTVSFTAPAGSFMIQFVASTTGGYDADWAFDNIKVDAEVAMNECLASVYPCNANTMCDDTPTSFTCSCKPGYSVTSGAANSIVCGNINECVPTNPCSSNAACSDLVGSYTCACKAGYIVQSGSGKTLVCVASGNACSGITCPANSACQNSGATYQCVCSTGYRQVGTQQSTICYRNGGLSAWTDSTVCSKTCAGGQKNQVRTCTNPTPDPAGGVGCDPQDTGRTMACNTQACPVGCVYNKPCDCNTVVTQYATGSEPNMTLAHFNGITPSDLNTAISYLNTWTKEAVDKLCKEAKCNTATLETNINNLNTNLQALVSIDSSLKAAQTHMRAVIDCNKNAAIEANLWSVYDYLCERSIAINQVKMDLMSKKKLLDAEKERCEGRTWITGALETWFKKY